MNAPPPTRVFYVNERFGWHICDVYVGAEWVAQLRFHPPSHRFYRLTSRDVVCPAELEACESYDEARAYCDRYFVSRT